MDDALRDAFAGALGRVPSGLFVVTARDPESRTETAFLGSWIMQAGFDPPALTVAVGRDRAALPLLEGVGSAFAVSVVADAEKGQIGPFARGIEPAVDALAELDVERTASGLAVVSGCLAWMECRTRGSVASEDHVVILGEVVRARAGRADAPAVHVRANGLSY